MPLVKKQDVEKITINMGEAKSIIKQTPISSKEGWDGWVLRIFTLEKNGNTPRHKHSWPHINYIIEGKGTLLIDGELRSVEAGDTAYIKGGDEHQFRNAGDNKFSFICIVPEEGDK